MVEAHTDNGSGVCTACGCIILENIPIGAYIAYTPSVSTVTILASDSGTGSNQTFTTSDYTGGWKVFKNNDGQLDIISEKSVGDLTLYGASGYQNAVYVLNTLCSQYVDSTYADSAVSIGSTKDWTTEPVNKANADRTKSAGIIDTTEGTGYPLTWAATEEYKDEQDVAWEAETYEETYEIMEEAAYPYFNNPYNTVPLYEEGVWDYIPEELRSNDDYVWLASRNFHLYSGDSDFYMYRLTGAGALYNYYLYYSYSDGASSSNGGAMGVRPVVSLKSGLKIVSGDGTQANPYVISF